MRSSAESGRPRNRKFFWRTTLALRALVADADRVGVSTSIAGCIPSAFIARGCLIVMASI
jgi:hypothetical protein